MVDYYARMRGDKVLLFVHLNASYGCHSLDQKRNDAMILYKVVIEAAFDKSEEKEVYSVRVNANSQILATQKALLLLQESALDDKTPLHLDRFENGAVLNITVDVIFDD